MARAETTDPDTGNGQPDDGQPPEGGDDAEASIAAQAEDLEERLGQLPIPGTGGSITLDAGGEEPESASMRLLGGTLPVEGQFEKGERVRIWVEGIVTEVAFVDHLGKDGYVDGTERRHKVRMHRVRRTETE